ncbi:glutathione S-transferase T3-like [Eutrema salsugineum]|uniref:glutathione S-transferase T3-like n=1 Tax=Eutrema salsugineum TaxID=72664 RepID=UPI000CED1089|nr:glutathione S-transferase T3-like [Eutrema salsugineum]
MQPFPSFSTQTTPQERKERAAWHPSDDVLLISSWLNTSKDSVVGNEQKSHAFWQRVSDYYDGSPNAEGCVPRTTSQCKQRWHKINDLVCKFSGAYDSATREKTSGMNENDVLKLAHQIFFTNHKKKFNLEYAWRELRNDQKWCDLSTTKGNEASKKRRTDVMETEAMETVENDGSCSRPIDFQKVLDVKEKELATRERLTRMSVLDRLLAKTDALNEVEEALKQKLLKEMLST